MNERARHFPLFDSLRAIAFLAVLTTHAAVFANLEVPSARLAPFYARLDVGVDVFFVISAFLLYRPFVAARVDAEQPPLTRSFGWRRFLRVAPPYWLALTVVGLWIGAPSVFRLSHIPWFYGFAQIYNPDTFSLEGLPQAWSLCVEASFYIFLPLWAFGMRRVRGRTRPARRTWDAASCPEWWRSGSSCRRCSGTRGAESSAGSSPPGSCSTSGWSRTWRTCSSSPSWCSCSAGTSAGSPRRRRLTCG